MCVLVLALNGKAVLLEVGTGVAGQPGCHPRSLIAGGWSHMVMCVAAPFPVSCHRVGRSQPVTLEEAPSSLNLPVSVYEMGAERWLLSHLPEDEMGQFFVNSPSLRRFNELLS